MNLDIDMTREQLIEAIGAIFMIQHDYLYKKRSPRKAHSIIEKLAFELHVSIKPSHQEWATTDYFKEYFTEEAKEKYLNNT